MMIGLTDDLQDMLQETRLAASGSLGEKDYTLFWQGNNPDEKREHGVGFGVFFFFSVRRLCPLHPQSCCHHKVGCPAQVVQ